MGDIPTKRFLTIQELSAYLSMPVSTIYKMVETRRIPFIKVGRILKFDVREIDSWMEKQSIKALSKSA